MNIESAQYAKGMDGKDAAVVITHDDGQICTAPINGTTWINNALNDWVEAGGLIAPSPPISEE